MNFQNVVFRPYLRDGESSWEGYAVDERVYAFGNTLSEIREDMREALAFHLDLEPDEVELCEFHEHKVYDGDSAAPDVWVRSSEPLRGEDACNRELAERTFRRRETREAIEQHLKDKPEMAGVTFGNGTATTGDAIAYVALPDDLFGSVLEQVGNRKRLYVAMGDKENRSIYWQCLVTPDAEDFDPSTSEPIDNLGLGDGATVEQFMKLTHASTQESANYQLAAA